MSTLTLDRTAVENGLCKPFFEFLNGRIEKIEKDYSMENLEDISKAVFQERAEILGRLMLEFIERKFVDSVIIPR